MKRLATAMALSSLIVLSSITATRRTVRYVASARQQLESMELSAMELSPFREEWDRQKKIFACFIEESHLEQTENALRLLEFCIDEGNYTEASIERKKLSLFLQDIADFCIPTLDNIL